MTEWELTQALSGIDPKYLKSVRVFFRPRPKWRYIVKRSVKFAISAAVVILLVAGFCLPQLFLKPETIPGNSPDRVYEIPDLPEKDAEGPVTVFLDQNYYEVFRHLIDAMEKVQGDDVPEYRLIRLPEDPEEKETQLTELRVEIMAGGGPDLFLSTGEGIPGEILFPIPEKAMEADLFYPMDRLMEQAEYFKTEELNPAVLAAGKNEQGQLILPLIYTYALVPQENIPEEYHSFQDLEKIQDEDFRNRFGSVLAPGYFSGLNFSFSKLADYQNEKLLLTEEKLVEHLKTVRDLVPDSDSSSLSYRSLYLNPSFKKGSKSDSMTPLPLYNDEGGITAAVSLYAAINRNSEHILGSFALLDFLLSDEVVSGKGFLVGHVENARLELIDVREPQKFYSVFSGIPVKDGLLSDFFDSMRGEKDLQAIEKYNGEITSCRFVSVLTDPLATAAWRAYDTDDDLAQVAKEACQQMRTLLQE